MSKLRIKIVRENFDYGFKDEYIKPSNGITFYYGGWHTPKYFNLMKQEILNIYQFEIPNDILTQEIYSQIQNTRSISIHIRRGDYLTSNNIGLFGGICDLNYYNSAISFFKMRFNDCHFFIFSNDIPWAKEHFGLSNITYVSHNNGLDSWKDMYLMTKCKHNIIANSTFSWWGAWLNCNPEKLVVCPNKFIKTDTDSDIYPETWIKING